MGMRLEWYYVMSPGEKGEEESQPNDGDDMPFHAWALALTKRERTTLQAAA